MKKHYKTTGDACVKPLKHGTITDTVKAVKKYKLNMPSRFTRNPAKVKPPTLPKE